MPSAIGNAIWLVLCGWWLALGHLVTGIPLGLANFKPIPVSLLPPGREIVPVDQAQGAGGVTVHA